MITNDKQKTGSKLYELLKSWGIPTAIAAAIVGALYAALVALGVLSLPSCSFTLDILPNGEQHFDGSLTFPPEPPTVTPQK